MSIRDQAEALLRAAAQIDKGLPYQNGGELTGGCACPLCKVARKLYKAANDPDKTPTDILAMAETLIREFEDRVAITSMNRERWAEAIKLFNTPATREEND